MITENSFTPDELKAALEANPALVDVMKSAAKDVNVFVYKDTEFNDFLKAKKTEYVGEATAKIYSQLDQDIISLTGATKGNEKTYEFVKRVISESKTKQSELEGEIVTLGEKIKTGSTDKTLLAKYEALEKEHGVFKNETIPALNKRYFEAVVGSTIAEAQKGITFNPAYDKEVIDSLVSVATQKMMASAKEEGGQMQFLDAEGKPYMNGIEVAKPKDIFLKFLPANLISTTRKVEGGGTGQPGTATTVKNAEGKDIVIPAEVKTKVQLHEYLISQGLAATSAEFIQIDKEHAALPTV